MRSEIIVTDDGSNSLYVTELDETYHSTHGAIQESQHVFVEAGFKFICKEVNSNSALKIFEVGLGTGLNALLTALAARKLSKTVFYTGIELHPLTNNIISQLNYVDLTEEPENLFDSIHAAAWESQERISNYFQLKKIQDSFITYEPKERYNLIYFDAFAPAKQSELWDYSILEKCYNMLEDEGVFVTYSAKGQLKRDLKSIGFKVETLPGPPGKFQMVRATK